MRENLPISDFKWVDEQDELYRNADAIAQLRDDAEYGYIFEVDLHYPKHLHDLHNDYPFCAERRQLPDEVFDITKTKKNKIEKLLLTFYDKKNYVVHYKMLKLALRHGLVLKKVHRILSFRQSNWMKSYIDLNIEYRKVARNSFEKEFFKLLINSVFGKTMENLRLRVDIKLANKWDGKFGARMLIAKPNFKRCRIFDEELVAIELERTCICMNKPVITGTAVLDISKVSMYTFLYDYLKPKYGDKCKLAYTDTDSFILAVQTENFYEDIQNDYHMYDTSNFPSSNVFDIEQKNKKVPGTFTDELDGNVMVEFVGLRSKCYAVRSFNPNSYKIKYGIKKKAKGVKKSVVQGKIKFKHYRECLRKNKNHTAEQNTIRAIKHNLYSVQQKKIALNPNDDKRYIIGPKRIDTLAWGHYKIFDVYEKRTGGEQE